MSKKIIFKPELVDSIEVNKITLGSSPTYNNDVANKLYVDNAISGITGEISKLGSALHFIGLTTTTIIDNATTKTITVNGESHTAVTGDVVLYNENEYLFDGTQWLELGDGSSHALKTITITAGNGLTGGGNLTTNRTLSVGAGNGITVSDDSVSAKAGSGITVTSAGINHADTSSQTSITANGRKYITGVTLDEYGHVTALSTGTETVTDTNTSYDLSASKSKANGSVTIDLTASGSGSGTDSVKIKGSGDTSVTTDANGVITISSTDNNQTIKGNGTAFTADAAVDIVGGSAITVAANDSDNTITISNAGVRSVSDSTTNGKILVNTNGTSEELTVYSHPDGAGNKHIPAGGSSGQILKWSSNGTATWGTDSDTKVTQTLADSTNTSTSRYLLASYQTNLEGFTSGEGGAYIMPVACTQDGQLTAQSFNARSDARLKENFEPLVVEKSVLNLPTYKFDFIEGAKNQIGCKAQDLQEICPEIVVENEDGYLSIQESKIVYLLLEEVKKLRAEVEVLKNRD